MMSRKWQLLFYFIELAWCIWLLTWICGELVKNPIWVNWVGFFIVVALLIWWIWTIYRVIWPKPKKLNFELEGNVDDGFFVTRNGRTKIGPFTYRHEAFNWITEETKKEMKK
ncbi:membrane protein [Arthrobacter phage GantcherGoblin]|nr:membrane protein [Arthrobacter phage GantcherGoblin]